MTKETEDLILYLSKEFDEKEGVLTCEFGIHKDKVNELEKFVNEKVKLKFGKWIITECDTCVELNGDGYLHASIEVPRVIKLIEQSSNHIKTI